jgi:hypothetical protein
MKVKRIMLELKPQDAAAMAAAGSTDSKVLVMVADGQVHLAYKMKADGEVYVLLIAGDNAWLPGFCSTSTPLEVHIVNDPQRFAATGLKLWGDQAFVRLQALLDF